MKRPGTLILPWLRLPRTSHLLTIHCPASASGSSSSRILLLIQSPATAGPAIPWDSFSRNSGLSRRKMPAAAPSHVGQPGAGNGCSPSLSGSSAEETPSQALVPWEPSPQPMNREFPPQNPQAAQTPHLVPMCFPGAKVKL